ncbi:MAG: hypothetical protein U1E69_19155 [Tabrizicola sp.]|uniref:hypothetical protein n=1 Tax=Tabrizicola sp. TaxID=2005166 RepID=UPI002AB8310A|nr:hypothetical protein [Tabrizicola sp.]MDZ4088914.1 hypothetical protein [Tabrizicola sp.]
MENELLWRGGVFLTLFALFAGLEALEWLWRCLTYGRMVPIRKGGEGGRADTVAI